MDFTYHLENLFLEVYVGRLNKFVEVSGDENDLYWSDLDKDFFDPTKYAGEGNIGHVLLNIKRREDELLK